MYVNTSRNVSCLAKKNIEFSSIVYSAFVAKNYRGYTSHVMLVQICCCELEPNLSFVAPFVAPNNDTILYKTILYTHTQRLLCLWWCLVVCSLIIADFIFLWLFKLLLFVLKTFCGIAVYGMWGVWLSHSFIIGLFLFCATCFSRHLI